MILESAAIMTAGSILAFFGLKKGDEGSFLAKEMPSNASGSSLKFLLVILLVLAILIGGYFLVKKYPISWDKIDTSGSNIISTTSKPEDSQSNVSDHPHIATPLSQILDHDKDEVFHVTGELVDYDTAADVCKQYGAKLASYDELLHAYQHGAEWCNYGWSENQTAYYPTQKNTWKRLQYADKEKDKTMCGVPGLNGGRFDKKMKFNVNCFGKRPEKPDQDFIHPKLPIKKTKEEAAKEVKHFDDLVVIPYSRKRWSRKDYEPHPVSQTQ
tara:strand:+ start:7790 stop:8599 length:810 start_codon:yes stop_codon:yes gene_type:complete